MLFCAETGLAVSMKANAIISGQKLQHITAIVQNAHVAVNRGTSEETGRASVELWYNASTSHSCRTLDEKGG